MTDYKLQQTSNTNVDLINPSGSVIASFSPPVSTQDEVVADAILDDIGVTNTSIKTAIKALTIGDITVEDVR